MSGDNAAAKTCGGRAYRFPRPTWSRAIVASSKPRPVRPGHHFVYGLPRDVAGLAPGHYVPRSRGIVSWLAQRARDGRVFCSRPIHHLFHVLNLRIIALAADLGIGRCHQIFYDLRILQFAREALAQLLQSPRQHRVPALFGRVELGLMFHVWRPGPAPIGCLSQPSGRIRATSLRTPNNLSVILRRCPETDMEGFGTHVVDTGADAVGPVGCGRRHEFLDDSPVGGIREIETAPAFLQLEVGCPALVMPRRSGGPAARARLAAGRHQHGVDARRLRCPKQHLPQLRRDWSVAYLVLRVFDNDRHGATLPYSPTQPSSSL